MTKTQTKKKKSKPVILGIAVAVVLIGAPLGSFLFLQHGYEYRLESLDQLQPKEISSQSEGLIEQHAPYTGNARLIHIPGNDPEKEDLLLHQIDEKIVDRDRFDIVGFGVQHQSREEHQIQYLNLNELTPSDEQFILVDTANVIRASYRFQPDVEKEIIRHLSVVIPVPKSKKIKLNRQKENE